MTKAKSGASVGKFISGLSAFLFSERKMLYSFQGKDMRHEYSRQDRQ
jgi:hypothetical protein